MIWIAPTEKDADKAALEKRLWAAAEEFRANSGLPRTDNASARTRSQDVANVTEILES